MTEITQKQFVNLLTSRCNELLKQATCYAKVGAYKELNLVMAEHNAILKIIVELTNEYKIKEVKNAYKKMP